MRTLAWLLAGWLVATTWASGEILQGSASPDGRYAIEQAGRDEYYFYDLAKKERQEPLLEMDSEDHITNVSFDEIRWKRDDSAVAMVIFYGSKMCGVRVYGRDGKGPLALLKVDSPIALEVFEKKSPKVRRFSPDYDEYALGNWRSNGSLSGLAGTYSQSGKGGTTFLVEFSVAVKGQTAIVEETLLGKYPGEIWVKAVEKWRRAGK